MTTRPPSAKEVIAALNVLATTVEDYRFDDTTALQDERLGSIERLIRLASRDLSLMVQEWAGESRRTKAVAAVDANARSKVPPILPMPKTELLRRLEQDTLSIPESVRLGMLAVFAEQAVLHEMHNAFDATFLRGEASTEGADYRRGLDDALLACSHIADQLAIEELIAEHAKGKS